MTWTPPGSNSGGQGPGVYYIISSFGYGPYSQSAASTTVTATADIQATITLTWTHGTGQTDANDPAPTNVWLSESGSAQWTAQSFSQDGSRTTGTGSASDGIGDTPVDAFTANGLKSGQISTSANAPTSPPPGMHLFKQSVSGGVITLKRTFHADASATVGPPVNGGPGGYNIGAVIGQYTLAVHATPYNFRRQNFYGETTSVHIDLGTLIFHYVWSSTSGSFTDLQGETIHENIVCSVQTDNPPFLWQPPPLTDVSLTANYPDGINDLNTFGSSPSEPVSQAFARKYKVDNFSVTQSFLFNDPATMKSGVEQPIPGTIGPFQIKEAVVADPGSPSGFSFVVTKDSVPSDPINLP